MSLQKKLELLHCSISDDTELLDSVRLILKAESLNSSEIGTLIACFANGPLFDGDVPSKSARDELLEAGFLAKVCARGEEGFNGCTQKGYWALKVLNQLPVSHT